eukprot:scaffold1073_cov98-Cylindrotheca_fusiformis.AAC.1
MEQTSEADIHPSEVVLEPDEIPSLWYSSEEYRRMLLDYKMKTEIQILIDTLQSRRSHRLAALLFEEQQEQREQQHDGSKQDGYHRRRPKRDELLALCRIIEQLSCQRQRIAYLAASTHSKRGLQQPMKKTKKSPDMIRAEQRFNRLMRQLKRALS